MEELTYKDFINNIIKVRGRFACGDEYHEKHHILPKCMGGTDGKDNLIDLFAREHFEAHRLLALENPENEKLVYAWHLMSFRKNKDRVTHIVTAEEYEEAREIFSITKSNAMRGENNPNYGKHHSDETKQKISKANKGKCVGDKNPMYGDHRFAGENNPNYGKQRPEETKTKISNALIGQSTGENNPRARAVYCPELDEFFLYVKEAFEKYGIDHSNIIKCCKGKQGFAGRHPITGEKLHWVYTDETNNSSVA